MELLRTFTTNFSGGVRSVTQGGREFIVAPLTLIVPGVLNGSQGPLLYPIDEISRTASDWNGIPLTAGHPQVGGYPVSATDPAARRIGTIRNARANGKLTAEGWFDVEQTRQIDSRIIDSLTAGKRIELSTGLHTTNEPAMPGASFNGRQFDFVARDYRPDHVAILFDLVGACSVADGCGVLNQTANAEKNFAPFGLPESYLDSDGELLPTPLPESQTTTRTADTGFAPFAPFGLPSEYIEEKEN